jgi:hypothetical protein
MQSKTMRIATFYPSHRTSSDQVLIRFLSILIIFTQVNSKNEKGDKRNDRSDETGNRQPYPVQG